VTETPLVELGAVILGLALLARLAARVGIPAIPFYLLGGLAVGEGGLVPLGATEDFARTGAEIGIVLLLFSLGLEYSATELFTAMRASLPAGLLNLAANYSVGLAAGLLLGWGLVPAMFLGGVTFVTSTGVMAQVMADLRWTGNRETPVVLSISIMEDLTMVLYLPVLGALALGGAGLAGSLVAVTAVAAVSVILILALRFEHAISRALYTRSDEALLLSLLGIVVLAAGLADSIRVSAAVGALLAGIVLSGPTADRARGLLPPLRHLFAAIFFLFIGLEIDPASIPPMVAPALALAAIGVVTKAGTGWWAARASGIGAAGQARAAALLIPRGEFSIALAGLAVSAGLEPKLAPLTIAYVIVLVVIGPIAARLAVPIARGLQARSARRRAAQAPPVA